ncbi:MAG: RICIN domain-containing protein [Actinomycetota bacterium]|nr:RICIN domain-containing protein [Actinomycetota bacterium]
MRKRSRLITFLTLGIIILLPGVISTSAAASATQSLGLRKAAAAPTCGPRDYFYHAGTNNYNSSVIDANGEVPPSWPIIWPEKPNNGSAANQIWCEQAGSANGTQGYFLWAYYDNKQVCLDVSGANYSSKTHILAYPCTWAANELFNFQYVASNTLIITPAYYSVEFFLCLNVSGGIANGHHIILYACDTNAENERFTPQVPI